MLFAETLAEIVTAIGNRLRAPSAGKRAQRVQDHCDVDSLLQQSAGDRRQASGGGEEHRGERKPHADDHALQRDGARTPGDLHRFGEPSEMVDGQNDVGGLRRSGGAARPHGDPDVRGGERRSVVQAVADHDGGAAPGLAAHGLDLL